MVKKICFITLALICLLAFTACGCEHVWQEADCMKPATCSECGATEGELAAHVWKDATCEAPKTCGTCGATEGEALGHRFDPPTCDVPATCMVCGHTEGDKLEHEWLEMPCITVCTLCEAEDPSSPGHTWVEATCVNPKTCEVCSLTEGDVLPHDWKEADCSNPKSCRNCVETEGAALGHTLAEGNDGVSGVCTVCNKAVEYFRLNDTLYAWTEYEVTADGKHTNPVTYMVKSFKDNIYYPVEWFKDGELLAYESEKLPSTVRGILYSAFYAQGKVYYFTSYSSENPEAVVKALSKAASKHVSFRYANYSNMNYTGAILTDNGDWISGVKGYVDAAYDAYGNTVAIVHKSPKSWDDPDDPNNTWAVSCNWKK